MEELVSTEENYVEDLHSVLFGYRDRLDACEERIRQTSEDIFGNLEEIYDFHSQVRAQKTCGLVIRRCFSVCCLTWSTVGRTPGGSARPSWSTART